MSSAVWLTEQPPSYSFGHRSYICWYQGLEAIQMLEAVALCAAIDRLATKVSGMRIWAHRKSLFRLLMSPGIFAI